MAATDEALEPQAGQAFDPIGAPTLRQSVRVLAFMLVYAAAYAVLLVVTLRSSPSVTPLTVLVLFYGGLSAIVASALGLHLFRADRLPLRALGVVRPTARVLHLAWQLPVIIIGSAAFAAFVLGVLFGLEPTEGTLDDIARGGWTSALAVLLVSAVIWPPLEEVLFRGLLFSSLTRSLPAWLAAVTSSAAFAAIHIAPPVLPYVFALGLGACWLYAWHRTLWAPIALHVVNNAIVTVAVLV